MVSYVVDQSAWRESFVATTELYSPGLEGVVAGITRISDIDAQAQSLMYRGYDIRELAEKSTYEAVAYLLLFGELPSASAFESFQQELADHCQLPDPVLALLKSLPANANPMDTLRAGVDLLAILDPDADDSSRVANLRKATRLLAKLPALVAYGYQLPRKLPTVAIPQGVMSQAERFLTLVYGKKPDPLHVKIMDVSLITYAEHGFNASTFSSRVTVSTLSDLYSGIISAIGTLKGPLHGGANEEAMKMLLEIGSPENAETWVRNAIANKAKLMGFGHREYKHGDPRAPILTAWGKKLSEQTGNTTWAQIADIVEAIVVKEKAIHPNVDYPTAYIYYLMGLPIDIYTPIFALARTAGWSAHIMEQLEGNRLIRPKAIYEGPKLRPLP
jgi:2-methylcitrate synthase/citrate synthase II